MPSKLKNLETIEEIFSEKFYRCLNRLIGIEKVLYEEMFTLWTSEVQSYKYVITELFFHQNFS